MLDMIIGRHTWNCQIRTHTHTKIHTNTHTHTHTHTHKVETGKKEKRKGTKNEGIEINQYNLAVRPGRNLSDSS